MLFEMYSLQLHIITYIFSIMCMMDARMQDNTLDQNAIIDFHPQMSNVLMVNGFSGHGLQQSPAAGKGAAELLSSGKYETLDLSIFSFDRCWDDVRPVFEAGIV